MPDERFDAAAALAPLKAFQRRTVDYVFDRLYGDQDPVRQFLVADEVGLGKTMVARGVIARTIEKLWDTTDRIDILYICSNQAIAAQNLNRLNVLNRRELALPTRMTLIPLQVRGDQGLDANKVNFISLTPGTTFDLRSTTGVTRERALLLRMLEDRVSRPRGLHNLLQVTAGVDGWNGAVRDLTLDGVDQRIIDRFRRDVESDTTLFEELEAVCDLFPRRRETYPYELGQRRNALVGKLRGKLSHACIDALKPDLIIMDEFQRFRDLLHGETPAAELARELFDYSDGNGHAARTLLLSATPYRMLTLSGDEPDDGEHYRDFLETVNQDNIKQFTQELQFLGETPNGRLKYQFGAYYFRETDYQFYPVFLPSQISATTGEELRVGGLNNNADIKNESLAIFTQESFAITDKLNLTVGLRYTRDKKEATPFETAAVSGYGYTNVGYNVAYPAPLNAQNVCLGPQRTGAVAATCTGSRTFLFNPVLNSKTNSKFTPAATLQYQWTPELMTYASYSQGFKSGGFNTRIVQPVISPNAPTGREFLPEFDPEQVTSYEIGGKLLIGRTLRLSAAAFKSKYKDIQIVVREGVAPVVRNAGEATINGFEVEGTVSPIGPLLINFGVGYTDFGYDSFTNALNAGQANLAPGALGRVDLDDMQAYTPKWSLNGGFAYRIPLSSGSLTPRVDVAYRSKTYFDAPNTEQIAQNKYALVNATLRYADRADRYSIAAGVTNLTNKAYIGSGNSSLTAASGYAEVTYGPPRMFTVEGTINF